MTTANANIASLLKAAAKTLDGETAQLDAEVLLGHALGESRTYLYAWPERVPPDEAIERFNDYLWRRRHGEPVAYITGEREFWSLPLQVSEGVLIPRPDTEILVEEALKRLPPGNCKIADLGTGSGAIALALAHERRNCFVMASDMSPKALEVARSNAERLGIVNIGFRKANWCEGLEGPVDMIVSNPPYICHDDPHLDEGDVRSEPSEALVSGADGLDDIRLIIQQAIRYLHGGGWLLLEHGYDQGDKVADLLAAGGYQHVETLRDLGGNDRVSLGQKPE